MQNFSQSLLREAIEAARTMPSDQVVVEIPFGGAKVFVARDPAAVEIIVQEFTLESGEHFYIAGGVKI